MTKGVRDGKKKKTLNKKETLNEELGTALEKLSEAKNDAQVDAAVKIATDAAATALTLATDAFKKSIAPNHTAEDEDVETELRDFATKIEIAAQDVKTAGEKKKASLKAPANP